MKILTIHADFIEFEAKKKAFKAAEEGIEEGLQRVEECLVVFTAVEKGDEDVQATIERYVEEITKIAAQVTVKNIVLYPYAHLSSNLGSPQVAMEIMKGAQEVLSSHYTVSRAPFGWYKAFTVSCKGHPLSELSRQFSVDEKKPDLAREYRDEAFEFVSEELDKEAQLNFSTGLVTAKAVKDLFPSAEVGSIGFYHDQVYVDFANVKLHNQDMVRIEKQIKKIAREGLSIEKVSPDVAGLQREIQKDVGMDKAAYRLEDVTIIPLFLDPLVQNTKAIFSARVLNLASAYWKGNEKNKQLVRVYVKGFASAQKLEEFDTKQKEATARSHLKIGKEQGLFVVSDLVGSGLPLIAPRGMVIRTEIANFLWDLHKMRGYQRVWIPHMAKPDLYKKSGHWDKFGDELFHVKGRYEDMVVKPMNCPHHIQIFDNFPHSYRDLPVRFFEPTTVYRDEKPGQLLGLSRVRSITQDDGHIFCRVSQIEQEVKTMVQIILEFYQAFGMDKEYWVSLSVRGGDTSKYLGEEEAWNTAEMALEKVATELKLPFRKIKGEAAFYGPKLDFMFKDALGREWQLATIQLDFNQPERFDLSFINEESKKERPVMIHRAISGSLERFMSVVIEHFAGKFPLWMSPVQVKVLTITDRSNEFAWEVHHTLQKSGIRSEVDERSETMGRKIRDAQLEKVNYIVTIGDKELENKTLAVRDRLNDNQFGVKVDDFLTQLLDEIHAKKL